MHEVLLQISAWPFSLSAVEVVLHSLVARLLLHVEFVIEAVQRVGVVLFALVGE